MRQKLVLQEVAWEGWVRLAAAYANQGDQFVAEMAEQAIEVWALMRV